MLNAGKPLSKDSNPGVWPRGPSSCHNEGVSDLCLGMARLLSPLQRLCQPLEVSS